MHGKPRYVKCSVLAQEMDDYIRFRRAGGVKYETAETDFNTFDKYLIEKDYKSETLNRDIVMSYLSLKDGERMTNLAQRVTLIRGFVNYLKNVKKYEETFTNIPGISYKGCQEYIPYIFTEEEITKIFEGSTNCDLYKHTTLPNIKNIIPCVIKMLYCTGMRVGELCNLKVEDVDIDKGLIYIREAKNYNKRIVTMSESLKKEVIRYCNESNNCELSGVYFFDVGLSRKDGQMNSDLIYVYFRQILKKVEIKHKGKGYGPRLHDLRHTFCCHSLKKLSKLDGDINAYIVYLSTFMGHKSLRETQKYIWLTNDLFKDTKDKLESYTSFISDMYKESLINEESL